MLYTDNLNLKIPEENEFYDVNDFNDNAKIIDAAIKKLQDGKADAEDYLKLTGGTITDDLNVTGNLKVKNKHVITSVNDVTANDDGAIEIEQVQPDWNATEGKGQILNKPSLAKVATSGSYNDLSNKPTIPTITIATQAEAEAGTNNTKHMTPLRVKQAIEALQDHNTSNWSMSKSASGWARDNTTGLTIQWKKISISGDSSATLTYPKALTSVYCIICTHGTDLDRAQDAGIAAISVSTTKATIVNGYGLTSSIYCLIIGVS